MRTFWRYMRLLKEFFRACLVEEFEYRANLAANALMTLFTTALSVLTVILFFYRSESIGGWTFYEVLALLGVFNAMGGVISFVLSPGMSRLVQHVRKGTLDYVLLKPVDSQFHVTMRHLVVWRLADVAFGLGLAVYAAWAGGFNVGPAEALAFVLMLAASVVILYSCWVGMMTLSFWAVKVDNLSFLFSSLFETARYPATVYKGALRTALLYVLPVGFVTTVPAGALAGKLTPATALAALVLAAVFAFASRLLWRLAVRSYTSASS